jgi:nicotinamidase-related amidase
MMMYTTLKEIVDPEHTALVVWDVHQGLVDSIFNREQFVSNLKSFLAVARDNHIPVLYTRLAPMPRGYASPWRVFMLMKRYGVDSPDKIPKFFEPGFPGAEICVEVGPVDGEPVINKFTPSIFIGTSFENMMRNRGINTVLFAGIATEIGIDSSARDCSNRGFYTIVVEDCVSSSDHELHETSLKALRTVCLVIPSAEIGAQWRQSGV